MWFRYLPRIRAHTTFQAFRWDESLIVTWPVSFPHRKRRGFQSIMYDVLHVPKLACNLFSVRAAAKEGNTVKFSHLRCWIKGPKGSFQGMGSLTGKLYQLKCEVLTDREHVSVVTENLPDVDLWHQRFGHLNKQQLNTLVDRNLASGIKLSTTSKLSFCEGCVEGKMQRKPFKSLTHRRGGGSSLTLVRQK